VSEKEEEIEGEIKAAPSAGLQVVGFVEQYATAP